MGNRVQRYLGTDPPTFRSLAMEKARGEERLIKLMQKYTREEAEGKYWAFVSNLISTSCPIEFSPKKPNLNEPCAISCFAERLEPFFSLINKKMKYCTLLITVGRLFET